MEAVLRTFAGAKSGLRLAFVIRAGFFTSKNLHSSAKMRENSGVWRQTWQKEIKDCHFLWECCSCVHYLHSLNSKCVSVSVCIWVASDSSWLCLLQIALRVGLNSLQILLNWWNHTSLPFSHFTFCVNRESTWIVEASGLSFPNEKCYCPHDEATMLIFYILKKLNTLCLRKFC